ncbi:MAG TPA: DNA starvation/stationary phase protection protein Dps [Phycisphaerae bacterium]|nr:DNA starvation/stationary phase protection protein Dps [Phycisphaerae bacterium]
MKTKLHQTRNDMNEQTRCAMTSLLNQQLADAIDLGLQTKQAHWNVKGPNFIGLHELFDKAAEELEEFTDDIAERAVELGGFALGTIQAISKNSRLTAYPARQCQQLQCPHVAVRLRDVGLVSGGPFQ